MLTVVIVAALIGLLLAFYNSTFGKLKREIDKFPGPPALPIVGNALMIGSSPHDILQTLFKWWRQYDKNRFRFWIGLEPNVLISDPKDIENVLLSTKLLEKSSIYNLLLPWLGRGLLTSFGSRWHSHRKMITPSFHFKILVDFLEVMNKNAAKFAEKLQDPARTGAVFDFQSVVCYCTLDIICETAMGVKINAMDDHDSDVVKAFQYMSFSIQTRAMHPVKRNQFLFRFAPEYSKYKKTLDTLKAFTMTIISKHRDAMKSNASLDGSDDQDNVYMRRKRAFLDTLLTSTLDGRPLTLHEINEEVSTFMFEGHDTTSSGISFVIYLLSRHPDVQEKVFQEQLDLFNGDLTRQPSFNDVQEMKYLDMVIKESQRLFPSVPVIGRYIREPYDMNGTVLPGGTTLNVFLVGMGYNDRYFPDPYKFDPERFNPEKRVNMNPFEYVPFSAGLRNCIGQKFAQMELKAVVSKIVRTFRILPPEDGLHSKDGYVPKLPENKFDPVVSAVLTLKSDNGILIRLQERDK